MRIIIAADEKVAFDTSTSQMCKKIMFRWVNCITSVSSYTGCEQRERTRLSFYFYYYTWEISTMWCMVNIWLLYALSLIQVFIARFIIPLPLREVRKKLLIGSTTIRHYCLATTERWSLACLSLTPVFN